MSDTYTVIFLRKGNEYGSSHSLWSSGISARSHEDAAEKSYSNANRGDAITDIVVLRESDSSYPVNDVKVFQPITAPTLKEV